MRRRRHRPRLYWLALPLVLLSCAPTVAGEDTVKVGILHSLTGGAAPDEAPLKDVVLMMIRDQNAKGGLLGRKLEPVLADSASETSRVAGLARDLLTTAGVVAVFGCGTSECRKAVLPVFEELNGLLFYPIPSEGEESSRNIFYTGSVANQLAVPAIRYLASRKAEGVSRWVLVGGDDVCSRTTASVLKSYLADQVASPDRVLVMEVPLAPPSWQEVAARIRDFAASAEKTAILSTLPGRAHAALARELAAGGLSPPGIAVMALAASERDLAAADAKAPAGELAAAGYFQSVKSSQNAAFTQMWKEFSTDGATDQGMEATFVGFRLWAQAVAQAGTTAVDAVRQAMYSQRLTAPSGYEEVMSTNHHLSKPALIGRMGDAGGFEVIWQSTSPIRADALSKYLPENARRTADWTFPWVCGGCEEPTFKDW